jgi:hypothetical protein
VKIPNTLHLKWEMKTTTNVSTKNGRKDGNIVGTLFNAERGG